MTGERNAKSKDLIPEVFKAAELFVVKSKIKLKISEPLDLKVNSHDGFINGIVEGVCLGPNDKDWKGAYILVSTGSDVFPQNNNIKYLLIAPRYTGDTLKQILNGDTVVVGIAMVKSGVIMPGDQFASDQVEYFGVGTAYTLTG